MTASHAYGPLTERVAVTIDDGVFTGTFVRQWPADMPGMVLPVVWHRIRLDGHAPGVGRIVDVGLDRLAVILDG
ncbi:hypothetical protein [Nostocoides vanveenii]|uniref:Uncharacterized protein n=1 Tax=Nostocoides vanveenii TaxID=330835 RepID=A0ABN2L422_9MICO